MGEREEVGGHDGVLLGRLGAIRVGRTGQVAWVLGRWSAWIVWMGAGEGMWRGGVRWIVWVTIGKWSERNPYGLPMMLTNDPRCVPWGPCGRWLVWREKHGAARETVTILA